MAERLMVPEVDLIRLFLEQKYVQRADERQKQMGLAYTEAETGDLARQLFQWLAYGAWRTVHDDPSDPIGDLPARASGESFDDLLLRRAYEFAALPAPWGSSLVPYAQRIFIELADRLKDENAPASGWRIIESDGRWVTLRDDAADKEVVIDTQAGTEPCYECGSTDHADRVCLGCNDVVDRAPQALTGTALIATVKAHRTRYKTSLVQARDAVQKGWREGDAWEPN
ncbi:hypothetical protein KIKIMORA_00590 [Brevundimonas phage vB_BpoS-Kikimora]|uniref:Uncharacterized protein n=1 Tax=Brevundimonas phage vB_BpoS-Kikimora TaxID=2948601 RepID=A0A9E7SKX3_9CAUD|nr:hypothetical protein KIKIMORA_00590 [Brevundimonas phage vB_BpoS-Kikimora]